MNPWKKCLLLVTILFLYLFVGAFVILSIEEGPVTKSQQEFIRQITAFVQSHYACGVTPDELLSFFDQVGLASSQGAFYTDMTDREGVRPVWSLPNSILFASSVVTTIGYGRLAPRTQSGKMFCVVYAVIGIPLCCIMLSVVGDTFNALWEKFVRVSDQCLSAIKSKKARRVLTGAITLTVLWLLLAVLPSVIFTKTEPWSWWKAQYFCFVSLSTIGFGDVVYDLEREGSSDILDWGYKMGILVYLFLGLSIISIVFKGVWHSQRKIIHRAKDSIWQKSNRVLRRFTLRRPGPSGEAAGENFSADSSLADQLVRRSKEVVMSVYNANDVGGVDALRRDGDRSAAIAISYRLTVSGEDAIAECDSGRGSCTENESRM